MNLEIAKRGAGRGDYLQAGLAISSIIRFADNCRFGKGDFPTSR